MCAARIRPELKTRSTPAAGGKRRATSQIGVRAEEVEGTLEDATRIQPYRSTATRLKIEPGTRSIFQVLDGGATQLLRQGQPSRSNLKLSPATSAPT